jgi:hypothetical protein
MEGEYRPQTNTLHWMFGGRRVAEFGDVLANMVDLCPIRGKALGHPRHLIMLPLKGKHPPKQVIISQGTEY